MRILLAIFCFSTILIAGEVVVDIKDDKPAPAEKVIKNKPSASEVAVDQKNGVVVDTGKNGVHPLPPITVNSAAELPMSYKLPADAAQDFYLYAHQKNISPIHATGADANQNNFLSLDLLQAENFALGYSWRLKAQMESRRTARGRKIGAIGSALPSARYNASYGVSQGYNDTQNVAAAERANFSQGPSFTQPLFQGGRIISGIREANRFTEQVEENILAERLNVRRDIRTQYYFCVQNLKLTDVYRKKTEVAHEYWQKTQKRYEAGDVPELDVLRYEVQYKLDMANFINQRNAYNVAVTILLRRMGQPLTSSIVLIEPFEFDDFDPGNEDELTNYALDNRPDLKSSRLEEKISREKLRQAKGELLPTIDAVAGFDQNTRYNAGAERYAGGWNWSAGLELNWGILSGLGQNVRGRIMQADAALKQAEFSTQDAVDQVKEEVRTAVLNILSAADWVKSQKENVKQAGRVLEQENIKWNEGAGDYLSILDAQNKVSDAESSYWQGIYKYKTSIVDLEYSLGKFYQTVDNEVQGYKTTKTEKKLTSEKEMLSALAAPGLMKNEAAPINIINFKSINNEFIPATVIYEETTKIFFNDLELPELE